MGIGTVQNINLKTLWSGAATHSTPWLARFFNLVVQKLGTNLAPEATAAWAGDTSATSSRRLHLKQIAGIVFLAWLSLSSAPVTAATDIALAPIRTLPAYRASATWDIEDRWYFLIGHTCNTDQKVYGFWPADPICSGALVAYRRPRPSDSADSIGVELERMRVDSENNIRSLRGASEGISVSGKWGTSSQLYDRIVELKDPVASFNDRPYRLSEFKELVAENLLVTLEKATQDVTNKRAEIKSSILAGAAQILLALVVLWILYRIGKRFFPSVAAGTKRIVSSGVDQTKETLGELHARHVATDETIRVATRASLDTKRNERAELRAQISNALDSNNPELAKTLMSILQKLERDVPSSGM
jgi:hypothetical protein